MDIMQKSFLLVASSALTLSCQSFGPRVSVLKQPQAPISFVVMDFNSLKENKPVPEGWYNYKFWFTEETKYSPMHSTDTTNAIACRTHGSASMLLRQVDISLIDFPLLEWRWMVKASDIATKDEMTEHGG
jgi:hypothetical protein